MTRAAAALIVGVLSALPAAAEPVVTIRNNGPVANRVNLAILGDGYTRQELVKFSTDVDLLVNGLFGQSPFREYARFFNIYRIDVVSNESGADHPERGVTRDTALGAAYNCSNVQRLICVDQAAVDAVLSRSLPADSRDAIMVVVNDSEYGGSGGRVAVASTHRDVIELMLHEFGHSLGLLADEYWNAAETASCRTDREPAEVNATRETARGAIKWAMWIDAATSIPTAGTAAATPGLYQGARFCETGLFRPTYNSKMRTLGRSFEQINAEQLILRFYNFVSPIDSVIPAASEVTVIFGQPASFVVQTPQPDGHAYVIRWTLNGVQVGTAAALALNTAVTTRSNTLVLEVSDAAPAVRRGRDALGETRRWTLVVDRRRWLPGESVRSANGRYRLTLQPDGNLVFFDDQERTALWATNTAGIDAGFAVMQDDGNFVLYDRSGAARWASGTGGNPGAYIAVQDDGNLVIYGSDGQPLWTRYQG